MDIEETIEAIPEVRKLVSAATHPIAAIDTCNSTLLSTSARTPGARWLHTVIATSSYPSSGLRAEAAFCDHRFQHLLVQAEVRHQALEGVSSHRPVTAAAAPRSHRARRASPSIHRSLPR